MAKKVVLAGACRTAIGSMGGSLSNTPAAELGAVVIKEALNRAGVKPEQVDQVYMGCVIQAGLGQNVARQASIKAGLPIEVPAVTINVVCGSGLNCVNMAAQMIQAGDADIVVAGGMENMSMAPYAMKQARFGYRMNNGVLVDTMVKAILEGWQSWAEATYLYKETDQYVDELSLQVEEELNQKTQGTKLDALTGTLNHTYFHSRMKVMDRSQIAPVAALCVNINDWRFANDHFGVEESDRLIRIVADILKKFAKPEYLIGRVDGDVFNVVIPIPEENEAVDYMESIQKACQEYEDSRLAPSVAVGIAMKYNVEETMEQVFSDAEYEMFENKMRIKQSEGYQERLKKGL